MASISCEPTSGGFETAAEGKEDRQHEVQVGVRIRGDRNYVRAEGGEEVEHRRQHQEVGERTAGVEQHHRRHQQRYRQALFARVQARGNERPQLVQQPRHRHEQGDEEGQLQRREEGTGRVGRNHRLPVGQLRDQRLGQRVVQLLGEWQQRQQRHAQAQQCAHQAAAQFHQMFNQRAFAEILLTHEGRSVFCAGGVAVVSVAVAALGATAATPCAGAWSAATGWPRCGGRSAGAGARTSCARSSPCCCACWASRRIASPLARSWFSFALQLLFHRIPLIAGTTHPQAGEAGRLGQALGTEHHQGDHRNHQQFAEADIKHRNRSGSASVTVVLVLRGARGVLAARLVAQLRVRLVLVAHALLEFLDRRTEVLGATGQALGAEHQQDDGQHDQPMPDAETAHKDARYVSDQAVEHSAPAVSRRA
ncbi:hypothetical protein G6F22_012885 [Rhizopus arrhizus]|nr:hypothetical protein G6F22_012885 [Rhizopus arrhizus]